MRALNSKLTYANVVSTLCLFLLLGGGAYAALKLPKNSVGAKQIKKNAVNSAKVKNGSLLADDFQAGQLPAGKEGPPGQAGPTGPKGDAGATSVVVRYGPEIKQETGSASFSIASCNAGETVTGGGYHMSEPTNSSNFHVTANRPGLHVGEMFPAPADGTATATGWITGIESNVGTELHFRSYVMCASP
jgi:hypothetical protein